MHETIKLDPLLIVSVKTFWRANFEKKSLRIPRNNNLSYSLISGIVSCKVVSKICLPSINVPLLKPLLYPSL